MNHEFTHLIPYGLGDSVLAALYPMETPARVLRVDRTQLVLAMSGGVRNVPLSALTHHDSPSSPTTGDWLALSEEHEGLWGARLLERKGTLSRKASHDSSSQTQVLASNIDIVAIVVSLDRALSRGRVERMLVAAWDSAATPLVVLTKADVADGVNGNSHVVAEVSQIAAGVDVFTTSAETGDGVQELRNYLQERLQQDGVPATLTFIGASGAGKSSLINALAGDDLRHTGQVRDGDFKGKHTTTARELVPVPGVAVLLDTPGIRGFALDQAGDGMQAVFGDIEELAQMCRFSDCAHRFEPGCAINAALEDGRLDHRRWDSYTRMLREVEYLEKRRGDAAAKAASKDQWRKATKSYRLHKKLNAKLRDGR